MSQRDKESPKAAAELRKQAEALAKGKPVQPEKIEELSPEAMRRVVHELQVHQIELEMQNEELRRAQVELDATRQRYFDLYNLAPVGYVTVSEQGLILEANFTCAEMLGNMRSSLVNQPFTRFILSEDQDVYYLHRKQLLATGEQQSWELRMVQKDGRLFWVRIQAGVAQDADGEPVCKLVMSDITARKKAEEALRESENLRFDAQKLESLGVLTAGVAHNMNNVLTVILGTASMQEEDPTQVPFPEAFSTISKACIRGRDLVKSLLQYARPTLYSSAPVELHLLIEEVCSLLESTTRNRITIIKAFSQEPLWIVGDAGNINHAFMNLCLNAIDAMPGGGTLTFRTTTPEENWVEAAIEDKGGGMTPEVLSRVMEPFYTTKEMGKGTGLGLSLTYGVIKAHGGTIEIASRPGQGTTVKLRFPRIPAPDPAPGEIPQAPAKSLGSMNVFLVDDEEGMRFLMNRMLKNAGVSQVQTFPGGEEVLERLLSEELPDLIILDQNMPGLNGTQTMARIRKLHPEMPILISSGQPDIESWCCFKQQGVAVISKPFTMEEIRAKLAQFANEPSEFSETGGESRI